MIRVIRCNNIGLCGFIVFVTASLANYIIVDVAEAGGEQRKSGQAKFNGIIRFEMSEKKQVYPTIIPQPQQIKYTQEFFMLGAKGEKVKIYFCKAGSSDWQRKAAEYLAEYIKARCNLDADIISSDKITEKDRGIIFVIKGQSQFVDNLLNGLPADFGTDIDSEEGYWIFSNTGRVIICGKSAKGCLYGMQTLKQLFCRRDERITVYGVLIRDYPNLQFRGWFVDRVINGEEKCFKRLIDVLSMLKFNTVIISTNEYFPFECVPRILDDRLGCTRESYRWRIDYANSHGIEVIPQLQLFSHCYYLTHPRNRKYENDAYFRSLGENPKAKGRDRPWNYCPRNPEVKRLTKKMIEEVIRFFKPKYIHVGMDEINIGAVGKCPRCKKSCPYELVLEDIKRVHNILSRHNVRMMIWSDSFYEKHNGGPPYYIAKATPDIPRDVIMCMWNYGVGKKYPEISFFVNNRFDVLAFGWYRPGNVFSLSRSAYRNNTLGYAGTTWGWCGPLISMPSRTTAIVLTGEYSWSSNQPKTLEQVKYNPSVMFRKFARYDELSLPGTRYSFYAIDLKRFVNVSLVDDNDSRNKFGWMGWGREYDLRSVPYRWVSEEGIPFKISKLERSDIPGAIVLACADRPDLPSKVVIPVHHKADRIVFLHATSKLKKGKRPYKVGEYKVVYDDGRIAIIPTDIKKCALGCFRLAPFITYCHNGL